MSTGPGRSHPAARGRVRGATCAVLLLAGAVCVALGVVAGFVHRTVLDADAFADRADALRRDPAVSAALGRAFVDSYLTRAPDAVAVRPLLDAAGTAVAGSDLLSPLARTAARSFLRSLTEPNASDVVLRLADTGAVVTAVLQRLAPPGTVPGDGQLSLQLAKVGGQSAAGRTLHLAALVATAAWLLPIAGLAMLGAAVVLSRDRRRNLAQAGLVVAGAAVVLGLLLAAAGLWATAQSDTPLTGALVHHGFWVFAAPLGWSLAGLLVVGLLVAASAGGALPIADPVRLLTFSRDVALRRPTRLVPALARALAVLLLGIGALARPAAVGTVVGTLVGLWLLLGGVHELALATRPPARAPEQEEPAEPVAGGRRKRLWPVGAGAGLVLVLLVAWGAAPAAGPAAAVDGITGPLACNGSPKLCDRPFDQVSFAATHNSMSQAMDRSWFIPEQGEGYSGQLDLGVRALLVDVWPGHPTRGGRVATARSAYAAAKAQAEKDFGPETVAAGLRVFDAVTDPTPAGPEALYLCHGLCEIGAGGFVAGMSEVRAWLDAHPREVVSLVIEDHVDAARIGAALDDAGIGDLAFVPPAPGQAWPTLGSLVASGRRVLVLLEQGDGGTAYPWMVNGFRDLLQDTAYAVPRVSDFSCARNRGRPDAPLFLLNHWISGFTRLISDARTANADAVLGTRARTCRAERRLPNFVAVNYASIGDLIGVVDDLNR